LVKVNDAALDKAFLKLYPECYVKDSLLSNCVSIVQEDTLSLLNLGIQSASELRFFQNLKKIDLSYNLLSSIPPLNESLDILLIYGNNITEIEQLPAGLKFLDCANNGLRKLTSLPDSLCGLQILQGNFINCLPYLPSSCFGEQYFDFYDVCTPNDLNKTVNDKESLAIWLDQENKIQINELIIDNTIQWQLYNSLGIALADESKAALKNFHIIQNGTFVLTLILQDKAPKSYHLIAQ
jgi:Leucine-rich repeat (LRR) protein